MNILIIGKFYTESFALHISSTFRVMGHTTYEYEWGIKEKSEGTILSKRYFQVKRKVYNNVQDFNFIRSLERDRIKKITRNIKIDLVLSCHDFLTYEDVSFLKKIYKAPIVIWFPDSISNFNKHMFLNANYDFLFFKDPYLTWRIKNDFNLNVYYLPECCNPKYHRIVELNENDLRKYKCELCTAGNLYSARVLLFSNLTEYDVKIWGNPPPFWMNTREIKNMVQNKFVSNLEKAKAFSAAKIVINNLHPAEIWGVNVRTFEIPACGGFELVSKRKGLNQLFEDGREVISFNSLPDLKEKINYYLNNELERKKIASAGYIKAHNEHTYQKRLELIIETAFNGKNGFTMPKFVKT